MAMDRSEFVKLEYRTLRQEISKTQDRLFKLTVGSLVAIPAAYTVAKKFGTDPTLIGPDGSLIDAGVVGLFLYTLPPIICIVACLYLGMHQGMMRAGRYIRCHIEPDIVDSRDRRIKGWEQWLEEDPEPAERKRRAADRYLLRFFLVLYLVYYSAAVLLAWKVAGKHFHNNWYPQIIAGLYVVILLLFVYFNWQSLSKATTR